jgi:hypothetical protein
VSRSLFLVAGYFLIVFFWPTYLFGGGDSPQKIHYIVCAGWLLLSAIILRTNKLPLVGFVLISPLALVFFLVFTIRVPQASLFEVGIVFKLGLFVCILNGGYILLFDVFSRLLIDRFISVLMFFYFLEILFVCMQFFFGDNTILQIWSSHSVKSFWGIRAPGTFEWVYTLCFVFVFVLSYSVFKTVRSCSKWKSLFINCSFFLFVSVVSLTQSKSGYVACILTGLYGLFLDWLLIGRCNKRFIFSVFFIVLCVVFVSVTYDLEFSYISRFIDGYVSGDLDSSTNYRMLQLDTAFNDGMNNWYKGVSTNELIVENAYFDYFYRYGIFGFLAYVLFVSCAYIYSLVVTVRISRVVRAFQLSENVYLLALCSHLTLFSVFFFSLSFSPFDGYKSAAWSYFNLSMSMALSGVYLKEFRSMLLRSY